MLSEHVLIVSFKTKTTKKSRLNVYFFYEMKNIGFQTISLSGHGSLTLIAFFFFCLQKF